MTVIINFIAAVAFFLFGVKLMGDGLESASRSKLKEVMNKLAKNRISAVIVGTIVTVIMQFSSATTILTIGMVNSRIINLTQAAALILGANLGTTIKSQILVFNPRVLLPFIIITGSTLFLFGKEKNKRDTAYIFMGFAIVVIALNLIGDSVGTLNNSENFRQILETMGSNTFVAVLLGIVFTVLFQSSSAIMAILIALSMQGAMTAELAFPIILGANIGSCSPALISSIRTNADAKRAALIHLLINVIGALIFLPLASPTIHLAEILSPNNNLEIQIANIHTLYNLASVIVFLPFINQLIKLSKMFIKEDEKEVEMVNSNVLDKRLISSPTFAETQMVSQIIRMAEYAKENVKLSFESIIEQTDNFTEKINFNKQNINYLSVQLKSFLVKLSATELAEREQGKIMASHNMLVDIEKIGDMAENIYELAEESIRREATLSEDAKEELRAIYAYVIEGVSIAIDSFKNSDKNMASSIFTIEQHINDMEKEYRNAHITRLNRGKCSPGSGILFLETLSNLERIGDHSTNICESIIKYLN